MKAVLALSLLAAAVSASPAVPGRIWTLTFHSDDVCASDTIGTASVATDDSCNSSSVSVDGTGSIMACNQDETTEGIIFYSDSACTGDDITNFASNINPNKCECINVSSTGVVNSAKVVPAVSTT